MYDPVAQERNMFVKAIALDGHRIQPVDPDRIEQALIRLRGRSSLELWGWDAVMTIRGGPQMFDVVVKDGDGLVDASLHSVRLPDVRAIIDAFYRIGALHEDFPWQEIRHH
jgi:hypothetical protein